jgi:hypothetical protein
MSKSTIIGLIFLFAGIILLGYQGILAFMGTDRMGSDFIWINISLSDFLGEAELSKINGIPSAMVQKIIWFLVDIPLFIWFFVVACIFFLIRTLRSAKL